MWKEFEALTDPLLKCEDFGRGRGVVGVWWGSFAWQRMNFIYLFLGFYLVLLFAIERKK